MNRFLCVVFLISISCILFNETIADASCGDWETFKDEKCFKIYDKLGLQTYEEAKKTCQNGSSLVSIRSLEEQEFFSNLLFKTHNVVDTVWIGAKNTSNKFKWTDDSILSYTNWAAGSPSNRTNYDCVQILPDSSPKGKWVDEPCIKKNLVACQKMQTWTLSRLQNVVLDVRQALKDSQQQLNNLQQNPVPIGFIYVQLPTQPEPKTLWPTIEWKDVTSEYAGLFFRAEGGDAAAFGAIQEEGSSHLTSVKITGNGTIPNNSVNSEGGTIDITSGQWSKYIYTGTDNGNDRHNFLSFLSSSSEVRPRNKSIRIWKRTN